MGIRKSTKIGILYSRRSFLLTMIVATLCITTAMFGCKTGNVVQNKATTQATIKDTTSKTAAIPDDNFPLLQAEVIPMFQGKDFEAFRTWCGQNIEYPEQAADNGIQGTVIVKFVIERDGSVSNVEIVRGITPELDAAAVKVVKSSPKWTPGKNKGKLVRYLYHMPITFALGL